MNIASISALHSLVSQVVGRKSTEDVATDAFSVPVKAVDAVPAVDNVTQDSGNQQNATFDEAFAKMMLQLRTATQKTDAEPTFVSSTSDSNIAAADSAVTKPSDIAQGLSDLSSTQQNFMDYMKTSPAERMRESLTGVSKQDYDAMSPEQKLDVEHKLQAALKEQQQTATADVNSKIMAARLALV